MLALAAADGGIDIGVFQWLVGLGILAAGGVTGLYVSKALNGQALTNFQKWKDEMESEGLPARTKLIESRVQELRDADLPVRVRDIERTSEETESWRQEATQQLDDMEKEKYAEEKVKAALDAAESSTSRGTMPYPKANR